MEFKEVLPAFLMGVGVGLFFYIVGGVAAPYFAGINATVSGALGFLVATGYGLVKK